MDNGNNLMSLAEIENSVYVVLKLPIVLGLKPVLKAAFNNFWGGVDMTDPLKTFAEAESVTGAKG